MNEILTLKVRMERVPDSPTHEKNSIIKFQIPKSLIGVWNLNFGILLSGVAPKQLPTKFEQTGEYDLGLSVLERPHHLASRYVDGRENACPDNQHLD